MKTHKIYPLPLREGHQREALIEVSYDELLGLHELLTETLTEANPKKKILLNFESRITVSGGIISLIYEDKENDNRALEKYAEFEELQ